jgi:hypothetical protein
LGAESVPMPRMQHGRIGPPSWASMTTSIVSCGVAPQQSPADPVGPGQPKNEREWSGHGEPLEGLLAVRPYRWRAPETSDESSLGYPAGGAPVPPVEEPFHRSNRWSAAKILGMVSR